MEQAIEGAEPLHRVKRGRPAKAAAIETPVVGESASQAYAMRVWSGQSVDVPPAERKARVFNALLGQNLPTDGIVFPA